MNANILIVPTPEQRIVVERLVVLEGVSWQTFKALLVDIGDSRASRIAYDRGILEIRMPLQQHEVPKRLLESFIEAIVDELEIEAMKLGALLLEREDLSRAVEPDSCFYIQNESIVRGKSIKLPADPPPDLVIESDYTNSSLNKFNIYAAIGVPELWRYQNQTLEVYHLVGDKYELSPTSIAFPFLPIAEVSSFIEQAKTIGQRTAVCLFRDRIQKARQNIN
ncbi:MAG: Uma2 family endonuclease [Chroococcus sp. CMT-3BRIN-NPC107]|jgi:Uma2 family endonuclease|nr:Uma2 family endonuclease [Chroococcus sp. CMT-3BRIN-NPC107]